MIKKFKTIKNMAVYQDFQWDRTARDKGNNPIQFKRLNIIYGRNYSGKTTLSRIVRALEIGSLSDKYLHPEFCIEIESSSNVTQNSLVGHGQTIRVFNEDFVRDNLQFIVNSEESIKSFAILGDDNNRLELEILERERELGSEDTGEGLLGELKEIKHEFTIADKLVREMQSSIDEKLTEKANNNKTGIKHNKQYGEATYNAPKLRTDIETVANANYQPLTEEEIDRLRLLLKEDPKQVINRASALNLQFSILQKKATTLLEKKITVSEPVQELIDDSLLQAWVRSGREYHEGKRTNCGFCGHPIPSELWERLDRHFSRESEELRTGIQDLMKQVTNESVRCTTLMTFNSAIFYSSFSDEVQQVKSDFDAVSKKYGDSLLQLNVYLRKRFDDIFTPTTLPPIEDVSTQMEAVRTNYDAIALRSNEMTTTLSSSQKAARTSLRLHDVWLFAADIDYAGELAKLAKSKETLAEAKNRLEKSKTRVSEQIKTIDSLKAQLRDESKGAERVNHYLNDFFGHASLSLKAEAGSSGYRFEVTRNGEKAHHLSEGECSLIAFCYFVAKLEDVATKSSNPIIWIDDPISSLDVNHIFFVFSLINSRVVKAGQMKQLFVSTHNLDFLKYLKRLDGARVKKDTGFFIVERSTSGSRISDMPAYLKEYVTEFNYLFHQIYKCATADFVSDMELDCYYTFGNNARKFLETFLYYKYPMLEDPKAKLVRFFGNDDLAAAFIERISNEYSHLQGVFERGSAPVDVPEMKRAAEFILKKVMENDLHQYNSLLTSIGVAGAAVMET